MTQDRAEKVANVLVGIVAVGAAYYVLSDRGLRRRLGQIAVRAAVASGPWLIAEVRRAWMETAPPTRQPERSSARDMIGG
jgi:hypothetical protein